MARIRPFFRPQIDRDIEKKLELRKAAERYHGSLASYVEGILDRYADGLLEGRQVKDVHAVRVRRTGSDEQRKTA